jgi:hypothetical protein
MNADGVRLNQALSSDREEDAVLTKALVADARFNHSDVTGFGITARP